MFYIDAMSSERFLIYDLAPATSGFYLKDQTYQDKVISSKPLDVQVIINRPFLEFGLVENEAGKVEFIARTLKNILIEKGVDRMRDFCAANNDLHLDQQSFPIRIIDQVTREQVLVDFSGRDDGLASIGAKPKHPGPVFSTSVALAIPK